MPKPPFYFLMPIKEDVDDIALEPWSRYPERAKDSPHENSHFINSYARSLYPGYNGVYVIGGYVFVLQNPDKLQLEAVAQRIPVSFRGDVYHLYLEQQLKYWNDTPTYILDEWGCYLNGYQCAIAKKQSDSTFQLARCVEFFIYALTLLYVCINQPDYDSSKIRRHIQNQTARLLNMIDNQQATNLQTDTLQDGLKYIYKLRDLPNNHWLKMVVMNNFDEPVAKDILTGKIPSI
jgi:hypothetical protein